MTTRTFRHRNGFHDNTDRIEFTSDGATIVRKDGERVSTHITLEAAENAVKSGTWFETSGSLTSIASRARQALEDRKIITEDSDTGVTLVLIGGTLSVRLGDGMSTEHSTPEEAADAFCQAVVARQNASRIKSIAVNLGARDDLEIDVAKFVVKLQDMIELDPKWGARLDPAIDEFLGQEPPF